MTDLVAAARDWALAVHPHARHLDRTLEWVDILDPDASEALRIAAVTHDIERAFPDPDATWDSARDWDSPAYNRWHQDRCADLVVAWLREQGAGDPLVRDVDALVRNHEDGGWPEADTLQAADSLSFLDTMVPLVLGWTTRGYADNAAAKLRHSLTRMAPDQARARALAAPKVERALAQLGADRGIVTHGTPAATAAAPSPERVLAATGLVRSGRVFRLARERFPGMPLFPGHPPFQVLSYRTPAGDPRGRRPALGAAERRGARLHVRGRARQPAHGRAHRRARAHDRRRRRPLARRVGTDAARRLRTADRRRDRDPAAVAARRPLRRGRASARSTPCPPASR